MTLPVLLVAMVALVAGADALRATSNPLCIVSANNQTFDLNPIAAAVYNGTISMDGSGVAEASVNFGWCATVNSTTCNVTDWGMAVKTGDTCVSAFQVLIGPATYANNAVSFQMWGGTDGAIAYVTVACDASGQQGAAKLQGLIVNQPIFNYYFSFTSVHGCASP